MNAPQLFFGCSQGRLINPHNGELQCFPQYEWQEEMKIAKEIELNFIELLAEREHNENNPIWTTEGINSIIHNFKKNNLLAYSVCLDYIINHSLFLDNQRSSNVKKYIFKFLNQVKKIGVKDIIFPLLEESDINSFSKEIVVDNLLYVLEECENLELNLILETIADSDYLLQIMEKINHPRLGCVYDTGNRYKVVNQDQEILALAKFIKHVHLKDKRNDENVVIGNGVVDFLSIFKALKLISYKGFFCFETNRGKNPISTMIHNIQFIKFINEQVQ